MCPTTMSGQNQQACSAASALDLILAPYPSGTGLDRPYGFARVTPCNGLAMVDFAGGNPWQSNTKYYLQVQNAGGPLA